MQRAPAFFVALAPLLALALALAACGLDGATDRRAASEGPQRGSLEIAHDAAQAAGELATALERAGFRVTRQGSGLSAETKEGRFARCERLIVEDRMNDLAGRFDWVDADRKTTTVEITIDERADIRHLAWQARAQGSYLDRYTNLRFTRSCAVSDEVARLISESLAR